ncbi:hypothetical protein PUV54_07350 [Hyphococcus flavus]|uniref:Uncharacterized protein n=1 Tax=Hyphococcus flavus TaxID=1866326 RepID=A0AAF0CG19_9PROT|nr:hypothetical protein [Hyphococcus flavus]WDI33011.1 hypothetical protein PUV54_07350 [Hyphococcus flavus]
MADLSEHFGPVGEFFILAFGLFLLLAIFPGPRQRAISLLKSCTIGVSKLYMKANHKSATMSRWNAALGMIFRQQRDLLFIVIAFIAFEYFLRWYDSFIVSTFISPDPGNFADGYETRERLYLQHHYSKLVLSYAGYAMFGWLAFQRASGESYETAAGYQPFYLLAAFSLCLTGFDLITTSLHPNLFLFVESWLEEPTALITNFGVLLFGAFISFLGAIIFAGRTTPRIHATVFSAFFGYFALMQILEWSILFIFRTPAGPNIPLWVSIFGYHLYRFTHICLMSIIAVACAIVLAGANEQRASHR